MSYIAEPSRENKMKALLLSAIAAASSVTTLYAQVTPATPDSSCTNYPDGRVECRVVRDGMRDESSRGNRIVYRMDSVMAKRAALGLELRTTGTKRDTLGVFVEAVTPQGPAETAGIVEGDRIAQINGVDLRTSASDVEDSYSNGLAAHRLGREVQKLSPGSRVSLRVYSSGRFRDVQVTAGKASEVMRLGNRFNFMMPGMDGMTEFDGPGGMMFRPEMPLMRERLEPLIGEPLLRERLKDLPNGIQLSAPMRIRTLGPVRPRRIYRVDATDIEPVSTDVIRELAATSIRSARSALKHLAADGIV
jgi:PDZ domain